MTKYNDPNSEKTEDCFDYMVRRDPAITLADFYDERHSLQTDCRDGIGLKPAQDKNLRVFDPRIPESLKKTKL